ncbi:MAG: hypothetical protein ACRD2C_08205 [Acidimicrobiales bacterium]
MEDLSPSSSPSPLPPSPSSADPAALAACERQLRRAGLPVLIQDYSATEDVFTRALPFLLLLALFEVAGAVNNEWSVGINAAAVLGGVALLVVSYGVFNRLLGRRFTALPRRVGVPELAAFVLLPALLPAVFGGQLRSAAGTALANVALLGLVWLVVGFGLFSIIRWAGARLFAQIAASLTLLVRALPLILFFGLVAFFTAEIWELFATVPTGRYVAAVVLFLAVGLLFLTVRLPEGVREIEDSVDLAGVPLSRPAGVNLALVILVSQVLQILLVTALVWLFFATFGALLVDVDVVETWTGTRADPVFSTDLLGLFDEDVVVTHQLLRAAFGIAAFSGLYYTVAMLVDATYRDEFVAELTDQMRSTFAIRADYLRLLGHSRAAASDPSS